MQWLQLRAKCAALLDASSGGDRTSITFDFALISLILINVVAVILESVDSIREQWATLFYLIETISLVVFSLEYVFRVWSIVDNQWRKQYQHPVWGRLKFMCSPLAIIDLLTVAPFWLSMFFPMDLRFLRVIRLLRVLKLTRYSAATNLLFDVIREESKVLGAAMFSLFLLLIITASATYLAENKAQPEDFANIPQAMWWAIITVTTVGYGDVVPVTMIGKLLGSTLGFIGVGMVALPAGIMASGFGNALQRRRNNFSREVDLALEDGILDSEERNHLKNHAESLSLSEDDIAQIILHHVTQKEAGLSQCPHCGGRLSNKNPQA